MTSFAPSTCDFTDCEEPATGQYLSLMQDQAVDFRVCTAHFARIEGGERPQLVAGPPELPEHTGRPALFLE